VRQLPSVAGLLITMGAGLSEPVLVTETAYHAAVHDPDGKCPGASPCKESTPDFFLSRGSPTSVLDPDGKWPSASPRKALTDSSDAPSRGSYSPSGFVTVHDDAWDTYQEDFIIQMRGFAGFDFWQGVRSRDDFERLRQAFHKDMGVSALNALAPLPRRPDFIQMSPWKWACYLRDTRSGLQGWLDCAIETNLCGSKLWRSFFLCQPTLGVAQLPTADAWHDLSHAVLGLPTMISIMSFLEEPSDVARLCYFSAGWIRHASESFCPKQWETMYADRWPAFYEAQKYLSQLSHSEVDWKSMYRHTLAGKFETLLEAYDREKKLGFAMSCMLAKVSWNSGINCYIAKYVSASQVLPEKIPYHEGYRLRFCPPSARELLKPEMMPPQAPELYGHRVLEGIPKVTVGQGVELQWKMQQGSPFGWWFGTVESLERDSGGSKAKVTMIFDHFPASSRWRRLQIIVGDGVVRQCAIGGWHGGVRAVTAAEKSEWVKFYPKEPVTF